MKIRTRYLSDTLCKVITYILIPVMIVAQLRMVPSAEAASPGTTTVSAGTAPSLAATAVDSFQPDLFTGRATTGIPIAVPEGRKGLQPALAMGYSSSSQNGWLGVGWGMDVGFIERSLRDGVPGYDGSDTFTFLFQGVNSELIRVADGTYRAKNEGLFMRFEEAGVNGWIAYDKSGTKYFYGQTSVSQIGDGPRVFRWCLDKVMDVNGNTMLVSYTHVGEQLYLSTIEYTGHEPSGLAPANRVDFILEDRPDIPQTAKPGFPLTTTKRLAAIDVWTTMNSTWARARRYEISYTQSARTGRSLLSSIMQLGTDGVTHMAPMVFSYQDDDQPVYDMTSSSGSGNQVAWNVRVASYDCGHDNYGQIGPYTVPPCGPPGYGSTVIVEGAQNVNGINVTVYSDGRIHIPGQQDVQVHAWTAVYLDTATTKSFSKWGSWDVGGLWIEDSTGVHGPYNNTSSVPFNAGWSIIHLVGYNQNQGYSIGLDSPVNTMFDLMSPTVFSEPQMAADVDGNGVSDLISYDNGTWSVSLSQSSTFAPEATWLTGFGDNTYSPLVGDWNADGLTDVALYKSGEWRFATSDGTHFIADTIPMVTFGDGQPLIGDFNGDGIMDLGTFDDGQWQVALGNGSGYSSSSSFDLYMEEGAPMLAPHDVRWKVRTASYDCGHDNYGQVHPYSNPPCGAPGWYTALVGGTVNVGGVNVTVGSNGQITIPAGQDRHFWTEVAVYCKTARNISFTRSHSWDVAALWKEPQGGSCTQVSYGSFGSVHCGVGWTKFHITGYNQNQGITCGLSSSLKTQVDIMSPTIIEANVGTASQLTGDFNGDGLTDVAIMNNGQLYVAYSDGSAFVEQSPWTVSFGEDDFTTADFNGDGLTDLAYFNRSNGQIEVGYSTGSGIQSEVSLPVAFTLTSLTDKIQLGEFNGDGLPDPAVFNPLSGDSEIAFSDGSVPDLLKDIDNGLGGSTAIRYQPSTRLENEFLPLIIPVVTEVTVSDGMGHTYSNMYAYQGGLFDAATKEFRGFQRAEARDVEGTVTISEFHQDMYSKGRCYLNEVRDVDGHLWSKKEQVWNSEDPFPGFDIYFTFLEQSDTYVYDGDETFKQARSRFIYDEYGNLTETYIDGEVDVTGDERFVITTYVFNEEKWIINTMAHVQSFDADGHMVSQARYYYDDATDITTPPSRALLTQEETWLNLPTEKWIASHSTYDLYGNLVAATDPLNRTVTHAYDTTYTFVDEVENPMGQLRTMVRDPRSGNVISSTDQNGVTTMTAFDVLGRVVSKAIINPETSQTNVLSETAYEYTMFPARITTTTYLGPNKERPLNSYMFTDGLGRVVQTRSPAEQAGQQVVGGAVEHDDLGRVKKQWAMYLDVDTDQYIPHTTISGLANPSVYHYDPVGRTILVQNPDLSESRAIYDDWTETRIDPLNHQIRYSANVHGLLVKVEEYNEAEIYTTQYEYDVLDNITKVTDHAGNITTVAYDSLSRKRSIDDPDMGVYTYLYDDDNNLTQQTDARNCSIHFQYDALNRLTLKNYTVPPASGIKALTDVVYIYDDDAVAYAQGKLTRMSDPSGSYSYTYDYMDRVRSETSVIGSHTLQISHEYDQAGRVTRLEYPSGAHVDYAYNNQGGVEGIDYFSTAHGDQTIISNINYNAAGEITRMEYGNGIVSDYSYNPQTLQLSSLVSEMQGTTLQHFDYVFDPVGNLDSITDHIHTGTQTFLYDDLNRLTQATGAGYGTLNYQYNAIGNMLNKGGMHMVYGEATAGPHAVTSTDTGLTMQYDAIGNMIAKIRAGGAARSFTYDAEGRLAEVSDAMSIELQPGWNLLSFPQVSEPTDVLSVLPDFGSAYNQLTRMDSTTDTFVTYVGDASVDQFNTVEPGVGYWLYVLGPSTTTLDLSGTTSIPTQSNLVAGWHILAGPSSQMEVADWFSELTTGTDYGQVLAYDNATESMSAVATVEPGHGYYVEILQSVDWTPPSGGAMSGTTAFEYNGDGTRVTMTTENGTQTFLGKICEISPEGEMTEFIFSGGMRIVTISASGNAFYHHADHLGSCNLITDQNGDMVELIEYTPFGSTSYREGTYDAAYKFTGQRLDKSTGLYFYNARYYDTELGRFISADTFIQATDDPQTLNRYSYCRNNPVVLTDPSGHFFFALLGAMIYGAIIGAVINAGIAAIMGGNIGQAALLGAVQGAIMGGFGAVANTLYKGATLADYIGRAAVMAGGSAISGAAGAAIRGEPIGKAALNGVKFSVIASAANYVIGQWSGYTRNDQFEHMKNGAKTPGARLEYGVNGIGGKWDGVGGLNETMVNKNYDGWFFNKSQGGLADVVESAQELLFGPGSWSREASGALNSMAGTGTAVDFIAHSQGGIQFGQALNLMDTTFSKGSTVHFKKTPWGPISAACSAKNAGLSMDYTAHAFDMVSALGNPWLLPTSILALPVYIANGAQAHTGNVF